jgi:hypothetical protein
MTDLIRYQQLENGIHEITFLEKNRASVDAFFQQIQMIYDRAEERQYIRVLVDMSMPGIIPMQYMFRESQNWRRRNPKNYPMRALLLYPEKGVLPIARVLVNAVLQVRGNQIRLRLENILNREEAVEWLLEDKS